MLIAGLEIPDDGSETSVELFDSLGSPGTFTSSVSMNLPAGRNGQRHRRSPHWPALR